jgi:hypothetical protein
LIKQKPFLGQFFVKKKKNYQEQCNIFKIAWLL